RLEWSLDSRQTVRFKERIRDDPGHDDVRVTCRNRHRPVKRLPIPLVPPAVTAVTRRTEGLDSAETEFDPVAVVIATRRVDGEQVGIPLEHPREGDHAYHLLDPKQRSNVYKQATQNLLGGDPHIFAGVEDRQPEDR